MTEISVNKFIKNLLDENKFYAPKRKGDKVYVSKIDNNQDIDWSGDLPVNSYKSLFIPQDQEMFVTKDGKLKEVLSKKENIVVWGINILDLQAFTLLEHVFENDIYYQKRRRNTLVIGFTTGITEDFRKYKIFHQTYKEDVLEHLCFDIFIEKQKDGNYIFFSGSERGQDVLENNNIKEYQNIEFAGLVPERGINPKILANRKAVELGFNHPLWDKLAKICLACGKCSIACPTCFCFDQYDQAEFDGVKKKRRWGSCFYPEFSKMAGEHKDLDTVKKRLYFWYYHKFVRIPDELSYYGCVSCMRCFKTCPVGINIAKNLIELSKKNEK